MIKTIAYIVLGAFVSVLLAIDILSPGVMWKRIVDLVMFTASSSYVIIMVLGLIIR